MTLAFSKQLNGKPTYFVEKILKAVNEILPDSDFEHDRNQNILSWDALKYSREKWHTIRTDKKNRWKAGMDIHFVINNRTKNRYQFAPIIKCVSTQKIIIRYWYCKNTKLFVLPMVLIDNKILTEKQIETLAINDGFDNATEFFKYFNKNFEGKIIHWTNNKY